MSLKKRVKIADSIAVLADPKPTAELDAKYAKHRDALLARDKPPSKATIDQEIKNLKLRDRYGEPAYGFKTDRGFKPDQEILIDATLAEKWEAVGMCVILGDELKKVAA
jgi:hypothetical protein